MLQVLPFTLSKSAAFILPSNLAKYLFFDVLLMEAGKLLCSTSYTTPNLNPSFPAFLAN